MFYTLNWVSSESKEPYFFRSVLGPLTFWTLLYTQLVRFLWVGAAEVRFIR